MHIDKLDVFADIENKKFFVGTLALVERDLLFEYDKDFAANNIELSPLQLPSKQLFYKNHGFRDEHPGLPGLFADALSDGWGLMLMNRWFAGQGVQPSSLTPLDRLAYMGNRAMGVLRFEPDKSGLMESDKTQLNFKSLVLAYTKIIEGSTDKIVRDVRIAGGSPGGARPKALIGLKKDSKQAMHGVYDLPAGYEHYVVKFKHNDEKQSVGTLEYIYSKMAKKAGIDMPDTRLLEVGKARYFAIKRFDRKNNLKLHMHTMGGLIHSNFRSNEANYDALFKLTAYLTRDTSQSYEVLRRMTFNVFSNNKDDHVHNFSYLMNKQGQWRLSPAYDLTYSVGIRGYHAMDIEGKKNPTQADLMRVAERYGLKKSKSIELIDQVKDSLSKFNVLATKYKMDKTTQKAVGRDIDSNLGRGNGY